MAMRKATAPRDLFPRKPEHATQRVMDAYVAFWAGRPSSEDCRLIITDLAIFSGYYNTTPTDVPLAITFSEQLIHAEGQRSVFGHMVSMMNPTIEEMENQAAAVRREIQSTNEG